MVPEVALILAIIDKSLELAILIAKDMPTDLRAKHWEQVQRSNEFWQKVMDKLQDAFKVNG